MKNLSSHLSRSVGGFKITLLLFFLLIALPVWAANPLEIVINEIAWMGTENSYNDEWLELYNNTNSPINLEGWIFKATDGTPEIGLEGVIPARGFYLLERTNDDTLPNILADQIYTGALGNSGENLELYDNFGNLIDQVDCSTGWFAGDNSTKQTMERIDVSSSGSNSLNWQTSQGSGGTPRTENGPAEPICQPTEEICDGIDNDCNDSVDEGLGETICGVGACKITVANCLDGAPQSCIPGTPIEEICDQIDNDCDGEIDEAGVCEEPESQPEPEPEPEPIIYSSGIFINEFLPNPEGPDAEEEWIEIFNQSSFEVNLTGWQITDIAGQTKIFTFPKEIVIGPQSFLVFSRPTTKITLNNDEDGLNLIQPDGETIDTIAYNKARQGQSYNRTESGWVWSTIFTPGSANIIPAQISKEESELPLTEKEGAKKEIAGIGEQISTGSGPSVHYNLLALLVALIVAIFSGVIILVLKKRIKTS